MTGFLSFSKSEGTAAAAIAVLLGLWYISIQPKTPTVSRAKKILYFLAGCAVAFLPTVLFQVIYAPDNIGFINGLASSQHPSNLERLHVIGVFFYSLLVNKRWHGFWIIVVLALIVSGRKACDKTIRIVPLFLLCYLAAIIAYYFINTRWPIAWWLKTSFNRLMVVTAPVFLLWAAYGLFQHTSEENQSNT